MEATLTFHSINLIQLQFPVHFFLQIRLLIRNQLRQKPFCSMFGSKQSYFFDNKGKRKKCHTAKYPTAGVMPIGITLRSTHISSPFGNFSEEIFRKVLLGHIPKSRPPAG